MGEFRLGSIVQGRAELRDGNRYVGAFEHDDFHGRGHYTSARGDVYEGVEVGVGRTCLVHRHCAH